MTPIYILTKEESASVNPTQPSVIEESTINPAQLDSGQSDDGQSAGDSKMYNEPMPLAAGTTTMTTSRQVSNKVKYWLNDMTEAAARSNDIVLMRALASLKGGVTIGNLDPVEELRVRELG